MRFLLRLLLARTMFHPLEGLTRELLSRILDQEHHRIALRYRPKVALLHLQSRWQSHFARATSRKFASELASTPVRTPVFILGHYRSGTTHLHELMSLDTRFASPTRFQAYQPASFLVTERWVAAANDLLMLPRRVQEDEIALMNLTGMSPYLDWCFPESEVDYARFLTFRRAGPDEVRRWQQALKEFLTALTIRYRQPMLLKSPPHTARIRLILETFPDAKFVHIRRNPFDVFVSTVRLLKDIDPVFRLRARRQPISTESVLDTYAEMYDAFFDDLPRIPPGQFTEIAYEDLERDPLACLESIYRELNLGGIEPVVPALTAYLRTIAGYQKNRHAQIDPATKARITARWSRAFAAWSYPTD